MSTPAVHPGFALAADAMTSDEEALRRSRALLQMVVDNIPAQIAYYDNSNTVCVFANDAYARANGKTAQWAVGKHCRDIVGEAAWNLIEPSVRRVIAGESISYERMLSAPDGSQRRIEVNLLPHVDVQGLQVGVFVLIHDISRRFTAEQTMRESEERLQKFASATTEAIIFHKDGIIEDCNEALGTLIGRPYAELIGRNLMDFLAPTQRAIAQSNIRQGLEQTYQTTVTNVSGIEIPVETTTKQLTYKGENLRLVVARNVSERRDLIASLAQSQAQYQALVDNSYEAILVSQDGALQFANPMASRLFGLPTDQLLGQASIDCIHPDDRALVLDKRARMMQGHTVEPYEARIIAPPGAHPSTDFVVRWAHIYGVRIDWNQRPALLILLADISEQHELRERLARALQQSEAILATTAVGVSILNGRTHQWVNPTMCQMLGYRSEELIGQETRLHYASSQIFDDIGQAAYARISASGSCSMEVQMRRKDGGLIWVQIDGRALNTDAPTPLTVWTYLDITGRKEAEEELKLMLDKERELGELKTRFVSMASHEFRTPLATIQTSVELLDHYADRLSPEERRESTTAIQQSVDRMRGLMENFLTLGRMGVSLAGCNLVACNVSALMLQLSTQVSSADGLRHRWRTEPLNADPAPSRLLLDPDLLEQIVGNLLTNACKYSAAQTEVVLRWGRHEEALQIEVIDQGMGIPAADLPQLFETFHRASNVTGIQGSGLGLAIVKRAVDAHGGQINVRSALGQGSCFTVRLPWQEAPAATAP